MTEDPARAALRLRQGAGARYDSSAAPAADLLLARRGAAYFARKLGELSDTDLAAPSRLPGWSRAHVVAQISYQARHLARLVEAARRGKTMETLSEPENQNEDVAFGATLPAQALRNLFEHSKIHLDVEWRDLSATGWDASVRCLDKSVVSLRHTPLMRARAVWQGGVDLGNGGRARDFPIELQAIT